MSFNGVSTTYTSNIEYHQKGYHGCLLVQDIHTCVQRGHGVIGTVRVHGVIGTVKEGAWCDRDCEGAWCERDCERGCMV